MNARQFNKATCTKSDPSTPTRPSPPLASVSAEIDRPGRKTMPANTSNGRLLDLKRAADYTGLPYWTMRDLALSGHLDVVKLPSRKNPNGQLRRILIDRADLDALIERMKGRNVEPVR